MTPSEIKKDQQGMLGAIFILLLATVLAIAIAAYLVKP